jgi:hypothetical protein
MKILFGICIGVLWFSEFHLHGFFQATAVTAVFIALVIVVKKWIDGEFDQTEMDKLIEKRRSEMNDEDKQLLKDDWERLTVVQGIFIGMLIMLFIIGAIVYFAPAEGTSWYKQGYSDCVKENK